jgi:hypothetical protein
MNNEELLMQRKRLMEGNQREVASIIEALEDQCAELNTRRNAEVHSLELLLEATTEKLRISNRRLKASEAAMVELQRETDCRTVHLEHDLEKIRREFSLLQDSMRSLVHAHKKTKSRVSDCAEEQVTHKQRERDLELREVELVDQLADARCTIQRLREDLTKKSDDFADMERAYLQSQRELSSMQQQFDAAKNAKHSHMELERAKESARLLQDSLHRVLHVVSLYGASKTRDFESLERARDVFRFIAAVGGRQFSFLGDAVIKEFACGGRSSDALALQDLKNAVHNFNSTLDPRHQINNTGANTQWSTIDPFLRLETERDFWLPRQVLEVASGFHKKYFHQSPIDVVYALVVNVATAIRDYSSSILSPGEVALLALERNERAAETISRNETAVRNEAERFCTTRTTPSKAKNTSGPAIRSGVPDVVRGITGLRCLLSQVDKLCSSSAVFKTLPAAQVREILSSSLRTMECLSRTTCAQPPSTEALQPQLNLHNLETALEGAALRLLEECTSTSDALSLMFKATRNALKAPQDPSDPEIHKRDCCASRLHTVLTKQFKCQVLSALSDEQKKATDIVERMRDDVLLLRQIVYDFKIDHFKKPVH